MSLGEQLPALVGVVVGALLSWGSGALTDRWRFRREQQVRWREQRLSAYSTFSASAKSTMSTLFRVAAGLGVDEQTEPLTLDEARPSLAAAFHDREAAFERVRLVGSEAIIDAAREWVRQIYEMRRLVEGPALSSDAWGAQVSKANEMRDHFYLRAREELGAELAAPQG
jgi:hypothetical protein